jgi:hypothetical protein
MDPAADPGPYIWFKLTDTFDIERHIERTYPGLDIKTRTVNDALRRGDLSYYQLGLKRYTTPKLIDEWMQSRLTSGPQRIAKTAVGQ